MSTFGYKKSHFLVDQKCWAKCRAPESWYHPSQNFEIRGGSISSIYPDYLVVLLELIHMKIFKNTHKNAVRWMMKLQHPLTESVIKLPSLSFFHCTAGQPAVCKGMAKKMGAETRRNNINIIVRSTYYIRDCAGAMSVRCPSGVRVPYEI